MDETSPPAPDANALANDAPSSNPEFDAVVMTLAELLGRQLAREHHLARLAAANADGGDGVEDDDDET